MRKHNSTNAQAIIVGAVVEIPIYRGPHSQFATAAELGRLVQRVRVGAGSRAAPPSSIAQQMCGGFNSGHKGLMLTEMGRFIWITQRNHSSLQVRVGKVRSKRASAQPTKTSRP